jgi:MerR family redox-sensitive transcriptional activator SoxR
MSGIEAASDGTLAIGAVAERSGLQTSAIRYYERVGLLPKPVRSSGRRRYDPSVLELLAAIEVAKAAGFSLREIKHLFRGFDRRTPPSERWRQLAAAKLEELDALAERIEGMRALLERGVECGCLTLEDCRLIRAHSKALG